MNTRQLLELYAKSYFDDFVPVERVITPKEQSRAASEFERDPVACLMSNVDEARDAIEGTKARFMRARGDGLFDVDAFKSATKQDRRQWAAAIDTVRGDYVRARSELDHWRGYVRWATDEQAAKVARLEAQRPDPRLPPERDLGDDDASDFAGEAGR